MRTWMGMHRVRSWVVGAVAVAALGAAGPSQATTFALGTITSAASIPLFNSGLLGPFEDSYLFTVGADRPLTFSAFVTTGFNRRSQILDMDAELLGSGGLLEDGDAVTVYAPEGWPSRDITFAPFTLSAGDYVLKVHGTAKSVFPDVPITSQYEGTVTVAAVPELETWALLLVGLVAVAGARAWRGKTL
jgi:hypothetical protein